MEVIRHPYQITKTEELIKGQRYVFVSRNCEAYLPSINNIYYTFGGTFKCNDVIPVDDHPLCSSDVPTVTVYLSGQKEPTFLYWNGPGWKKSRSWDFVKTFIGGPPRSSGARLIVPQERWTDDPKVYDSVELASDMGNVETDWEQRAKVRRDNAMAKFFGF